ncbi:MAG: DGQHR domain-containing protein [Methanobacteriota archaeon]
MKNPKRALQAEPESADEESEFSIAPRVVTTPVVKYALEYKQHDETFYSTVWTGPELAANTTVPTFDDQTDDGYQRALKRSKFRKAARHLAQKGLFPTGMLLSVRGSDRKRLQVEEVARNGACRVVKVTIPAGVTVYIVDGQHRRYALEEAVLNGVELDDFGMNAIIFLADDELGEALQFKMIHNEQKKLDTGLTDRIILRELEKGRVGIKELKALGEHKKVRELTAVKVMRLLDERGDSPWNDRIKPPNAALIEERAEEAGEEAPEWDITERSMSTSLKPVVETLPTYAPEEIADVLIAYWRAIVELCKRAWDDAEEYRYLHNTTGVYIMHALFPAVFAESMKFGGPSKANFRDLIERAGVDDDFFKVEGDLKGVGGLGGFRNKAIELQNAMTE